MPTAIRIVQDYFPEVTEVNDADKPIEIEVTRRDSDSATIKNHKGCAMAVACKRKMKADGVIISVKTAYIIKGTVATRYQLPESVSREVVSFDRKAGFAPGKYSLKAPNRAHRLGYKGEKHDPSQSHGGRELIPHHITEGIRTVMGAKNIS